jgi:hypothetical protein
MKMSTDECSEGLESSRQNMLPYRSYTFASKNLLAYDKGCVSPEAVRTFPTLRKMRTQLESPSRSDASNDSTAGPCETKLASTATLPPSQARELIPRPRESQSSDLLSHPLLLPPYGQGEMAAKHFQQLVSSVMGNYLAERLDDAEVKKQYLSYAGALASYKTTSAYLEAERRQERLRAQYAKDTLLYHGIDPRIIAQDRRR